MTSSKSPLSQNPGVLGSIGLPCASGVKSNSTGARIAARSLMAGSEPLGGDSSRRPRSCQDEPRARRLDSDRCPLYSRDRCRGGATMIRRGFPVELIVGATVIACVLLLAGWVGEATAQAKPEGEMRWALYVTLAPVWFDPGEIGGLTPFWVLYAIHDALVKPMPGNLLTPSLAESWTVSPDQRVYEFKLREGVKFHNGDPFTADDVKFSFQRAEGAKLLHEKVREVEIVGPARVRFHLHEPWPDFMTFYGTLISGSSWVVPKKYVEKVGDDGFKKFPVGLGPYKFVSHTPGVELIMEANESYWRKMPSV